MCINVVKNNIDVLRRRLNQLLEVNVSKADLTSNEILELSQKLDKYITDYFTYNKSNYKSFLS